MFTSYKDPSSTAEATGETVSILDATRGMARRRRLGLVAASLVILTTASTVYMSTHLPSYGIMGSHFAGVLSSQQAVLAPGISPSSFAHGLAQCRALLELPPTSTPADPKRQYNPRGVGGTKLLIKNAHIWLGDRYVDGDILVQDGVIRRVVAGNESVEQDHQDARVIDAGGRVVTPGIVDMHSHMLVESFTHLAATVDNNEMTNPTTPYVRTLDAMNLGDPALKVVASGGVTTSLILPGSGNLMGGEAAVVKLRPVSTLSTEDMLVTANATKDEAVWRYMKMACGENPKRYYGRTRKEMPMTRMGEAYLFRKKFQEAKALLRAQDDWCDAAVQVNRTEGHRRHLHTRLSEPYPEDLALESLVALLRHKVKLNVHCYLPQDIEAMVRHSLEFDFEIAAFHHALSAWQVPDVIKRAKTNITVATFADMWGYKHEGWDTNVNAPNILTDAGIPVALKSDHPVTNARDLIHEAQKAYHYGFDEHKALAAVTSIPAKALGLDYRIGSIDPGKDADIVIWERHPLRLGAHPRHVIVDGLVMDFKAPWFKHVDEEEETTFSVIDEGISQDHHVLPARSGNVMTASASWETVCDATTDTFILRNISRIYAGPGETVDGPTTLIVRAGVVTCYGLNCEEEGSSLDSAAIFDTHGAVVTPGLVSAGTSMGLFEIIAERSTLDGETKLDLYDPLLVKKIPRAADGIKLGGLHMEKAFKSGVTTSISQPLVDPSYTVAGVSAAFRTGVEHTVLGSNSTFIQSEAAIYFTISHDSALTVSQQIGAIRHLLTDFDPTDTTNIFARASTGALPVVIQTDSKDEIASVAVLKQELPRVRFIIAGGAEAHFVAEYLKDIPVILLPARCFATTWSSRQCLYGPPLTPDTVLDVLLRHGVRVGLATDDMGSGYARNLLWEAGWNLAHNAALTPEDAVGLVTWNLADMFGLHGVGRVAKNAMADFVVYNDDPFVFGTRVQLVYGGGRRGPLCFPKQI